MDFITTFLHSLITLGGNINWSNVKLYLFNTRILHGVVITIMLSVFAQFVGTLLGLVLYLLRRSKVRVFNVIGEFYIWIFRGTPLLLQILLLYTIFPLLHFTKTIQNFDFFPALGFTQVPLEAFLIALIAFSLNEGAYMAEIVRSGIDSIDVGQMEAAKSLGMTYGLAMFRIIIPQAARVIIPPLGNEFNNMLKTTSLASAASLFELFNTASQIGANSFILLDLLIVAAFWYLLMTTIWGFVQSALESKYNPSNNEEKPQSLVSRLLGSFATGGSKTVVGTEGR